MLQLRCAYCHASWDLLLLDKQQISCLHGFMTHTVQALRLNSSALLHTCSTCRHLHVPSTAVNFVLGTREAQELPFISE